MIFLLKPIPTFLNCKYYFIILLFYISIQTEPEIMYLFHILLCLYNNDCMCGCGLNMLLFTV